MQILKPTQKMKQRKINVLTVLLSLRRLFIFSGLLASAAVSAQDDLRLNDLEYFERLGNVTLRYLFHSVSHYIYTILIYILTSKDVIVIF